MAPFDLVVLISIDIC